MTGDPSSESPSTASWRTFLTLWWSQSISNLATNVGWFAVIVYLTTDVFAAPSQRADLALALGAMGLMTSVPQLVLGAWAGSVTDRHSRRAVMLVCDSIGALVALGITLMVWSGVQNVALLLLAVFAARLAEIFHASAFEASYSMLIPESGLARANGLMQTSYSVGYVAAPALAALIIALPGRFPDALWGLKSGVGLAMALDSASFVLAALVLIRLRIPSPQERPAPGQKADFRGDFQLGWQYIWQRRPLLMLLLTLGVTNVANAPLILYEPLLAKFSLAADFAARGLNFESGFAVMTTTTAVGTLLGGLIVTSWGGLKTRRVYGVLLPLLGMALSVVVLGLSKSLIVSCAALLVFGTSFPLVGAHAAALWMSQVPPPLQGRVFGVRSTISRSTIPFAMAAFSVLSARFAPGPVVVALGALSALTLTLALLSPWVRRVEDREYLESLAAPAGEASASD
ncbi:MFS transporter [Deinococcus sp.]|uniref:MFS transporter n=1 Tax=Deinococcus sp. TaxID=47478 RepID=UPI0025E631A6|nr:MFS transporter [Deinococcus sp.]